MHKILTGDEFQKLPVDHKVDYRLTPGAGWKYAPLPGLINTYLYQKLSPEKQVKFRWKTALQKFERFVL